MSSTLGRPGSGRKAERFRNWQGGRVRGGARGRLAPSPDPYALRRERDGPERVTWVVGLRRSADVVVVTCCRMSTLPQSRPVSPGVGTSAGGCVGLKAAGQALKAACMSAWPSMRSPRWRRVRSPATAPADGRAGRHARGNGLGDAATHRCAWQGRGARLRHRQAQPSRCKHQRAAAPRYNGARVFSPTSNMARAHPACWSRRPRG